jgi:hypothetical protein
MLELPLPEFLENASADPVAIQNDEGRLLLRIKASDRLADVRQFDLHADDADKVKNVATVRFLGEAEFGADGPVAAALRTRYVPRMNNQFEDS